MSLLVILLCASCVLSAELNSSVNKENVREEKLRSALIDAFQNIKHASAKGGIDDESPHISDLVESMSPNSSKNHKRPEENLDVLTDDDGLTFAEAFGDVEPERRTSSTEKSHNVQHIVKTTKQADKTTSKPNKDVFSKLNESIRNTLNESKLQLKMEVSNYTDFVSIENMLKIIDSEILVTQWREIQRSVKGLCKEEIQEYVNGLLQRKVWALKSKFVNFINSRK
ncbi:unnamed protein product [Parnassius apollo]|uniref:(apollo) hypothetical protein n=1 Tax=Parnassius apollo TaxID=110799 RepID=A0A8S3XPE2_PARAO|nr:unnamed protein product [Parnassius apollo]